MKINYDKIADAVYVNVGEGRVAKTLKMEDRLLVDVDRDGNVVGIELLDASSQRDLITSLEQNVSNGVPIAITHTTPTAA